MNSIKRGIKRAIKSLLPGHLPDFLVVGAQKAATTSLHFYLNQHPGIIGSRPKEVCFFDRDENYEKGLSWYTHNFPNTKSLGGRFKYFESTPEYLYRSYVAERIHRFNPHMKIVILLRDPVQRAFSAWGTYLAFKNRGWLPASFYKSYATGGDTNMLNEFYLPSTFPDFKQVVEEDIRKFITSDPREEPSIVRRGVYYPQVKKYIDLFGRDQILVLGFKDLIGAHKAIPLNAILRFIDLPPSDWKFLNDNPKNTKWIKDVFPSNMEEYLVFFYKTHNDRLFDLIGFKPNW